VVGSPARYGADFAKITDPFWQQDASSERKAVHQQRLDKFRPQVSKLKGSDALIARYIMNAAQYWYDPHFDSAPFWKDVHLNMSLLGSFFKSFGNYDVRHGTPIQRPILLALGRYDYSVPYTVWETVIRDWFSNLTYSLFDKSGHTPFYEERERFENELVTWLNKIGGGS